MTSYKPIACYFYISTKSLEFQSLSKNYFSISFFKKNRNNTSNLDVRIKVESTLF